MPQQPLPICQRPIQLHPNPTMWASDDDARDWIARILRGEYHPVRDHIGLPYGPLSTPEANP